MVGKKVMFLIFTSLYVSYIKCIFFLIFFRSVEKMSRALCYSVYNCCGNGSRNHTMSKIWTTTFFTQHPLFYVDLRHAHTTKTTTRKAKTNIWRSRRVCKSICSNHLVSVGFYVILAWESFCLPCVQCAHTLHSVYICLKWGW